MVLFCLFPLFNLFSITHSLLGMSCRYFLVNWKLLSLIFQRFFCGIRFFCSSFTSTVQPYINSANVGWISLFLFECVFISRNSLYYTLQYRFSGAFFVLWKFKQFIISAAFPFLSAFFGCFVWVFVTCIFFIFLHSFLLLMCFFVIFFVHFIKFPDRK